MKKAISYTISLFASLLIFLGLPLLGWGFRDILQFFTNPAHLAYAIIILALQVFALVYYPQVGRNKENRKRGIQQYKVDLVLIQIFSLAIVFFASFSDRHSFAAYSGEKSRLFRKLKATSGAVRIPAIILPGWLFYVN
jgi:Ca2+/H+ antiporter